ncbi:transcriptional enhancer factor TEF-5 isoform X2 [Oncorhynchus mykiss]|uniref:transcriptional enhancer factor TEF-5 isoform X2 n=1 Tax=Oncorhynchus mykiss TaxID=8022 RepID=UPI000B4F4511|nr:transcriptional enhancer factor TEF-5 isoform X2 [Oncorhynchus mykiss]XP_029526795.1 transcriptional enhancer factor TEF-5 isoform X2 [Oncorhynchus nerka]XP_046198994.1 transcriptional enhancer factor TEF-5-like isoform X2 [Oncorhynchus gorbuscha]XP_052329200.1 transcriptional enhancer factor TEF-5-like isoform X2 [Oncorhynchus keta]
MDGDAEGVWSPDIEQSFQEALAIYPPCGRRKIILSDEGKMYGRNELIARYIKLRTGKTRTRKQVSSHIQVLARKKVREYQAGIKVSSHLQVLARRKSREIQSKLKDQASKDKALQNMAALSSAQIVSPSLIKSQLPPLPHSPYPPQARFWPGPIPGQPGPSQELVLELNPGRIPGLGRNSYAIKPFAQSPYPNLPGPAPPPISTYEPLAPPLPPAATAVPVWQDRTIASSKLRMLEYSAFMEVQRDPDNYSKHLFVHIGQTNPSYSDPLLEAVDIRQIYDKFPEKKGGLKELYEKGPQNAFFLVKFWADLNSSGMQDGPGSFYGVSSQYSSSENMTITVSTKVCSFGKQVVEKVETEYARMEGGKCVYRIHRSPMCEYMINFIHKLKHLPEKYMMNSVLENFTILQVVTNRDTQETLLCIAFVFEVSTSEHGAQYHVYRLVKD